MLACRVDVSLCFLAVSAIFGAAPAWIEAADAKAPIQVFILAGQSNMEGQGVVDLDHPQHYNGGRGTLRQVADDPAKASVYQHIRTKDGQWAVRDDVWCRYRTQHELKKGPLTIGFAVYPGKHHIGPEFQFGHVIGDAIEAPVLLIKTAWGGKSLYVDFRPPSSSGEAGPFYKQMIAEVREALRHIPDDFPELKDRRAEFAGFVWFQGWNDAFGPPEAKQEYEQNLVNLIHDVRAEFNRPNLPVVIGELGNGGEQVGEQIMAIRQAQAAAARRPDFQGRVAFVKTTAFARPPAESPNVSHGHHWYGNAESYFLIGDALGKAMRELIAAPTPAE
ncbi:MAG: hypothetical protein KDA71_06035 [Planctomycetales bacterium]|nr:hypothetical protein [Planctomycetales bacterium]